MVEPKSNGSFVCKFHTPDNLVLTIRGALGSQP